MPDKPIGLGLGRSCQRLTRFLRKIARAGRLSLWIGAAVVLGISGADSGRANDILTLSDGRSRGNSRAPVTLIEYSDFTCGFCKKFFLETWPRIKANYVDTGKVRFLYRDYPRADQGPGLEAAIAARCAGKQGRYWAMHDRIFSGSGRLSEEVFQHHARDIGLDVPVFADCRRERPHLEDIFRDRAQALALGFRGTPGFVLLPTEDGRPDLRREKPIGLPGAFPYQAFEELIESLLAETMPPGKG